MTRRHLLLGLVAGLAAPTRLDAQSPAPASWAAGRHPLGLGTDRDGLVHVPAAVAAGRPLPLLVMFHGAGGSCESANVAAVMDMAETHGAIVLAPDSRDPASWDALLGAAGPDLDFLQQALQHTRAHCRVDAAQLALGGFSDGASYTLGIGIEAGDTFPHLMAFSPGVMRPRSRRALPKVFISHGDADGVMPIDDTSRRFVPRLRTLGYDVTYREFEGRHVLPPDVLRAAFAWWRG